MDEEVEHVFSGECDINLGYGINPDINPAMEMEGAEVLWKRSLEQHNIRYGWMVSDGHSKAFTAV